MSNKRETMRKTHQDWLFREDNRDDNDDPAVLFATPEFLENRPAAEMLLLLLGDDRTAGDGLEGDSSELPENTGERVAIAMKLLFFYGPPRALPSLFFFSNFCNIRALLVTGYPIGPLGSFFMCTVGTHTQNTCTKRSHKPDQVQFPV